MPVAGQRVGEGAHAAARHHAAGVEGRRHAATHSVGARYAVTGSPPVSATLRVTSAAADGPLLVKVTVPVTLARRPVPAPPGRP